MKYVDFYKEFGPLGYLANYSEYGFYKNGVYYKTVEHYYQSEKFSNLNIKKLIINSSTPKEASNIGRDRNNIRIDNFKNLKNQVMYDGLYEKFFQNIDIRNKLIRTGNAIIREMTIDEYYWGIGKDLSGQNNIGKLLMKVRDVLRNDLLNKMLNNCIGKDIVILIPDSKSIDSKVSSGLLENIFKSMGINCSVLARDVNNFKIDNNKYYFLVNHNILGDISKDRVVGCIDVHELTGEIDDIISIDFDSCSLVIYYLFHSSYNFSITDKELILETLI